jgi:Uma2 family endonuclease
MTVAVSDRSEAPALFMSEEEYTRHFADSKFTEWVNGDVIFTMAASEDQDKLQGWIRTVIEGFVARRKLGEVRGPNFTMRIDHVPSRRDPDLTVTLGARREILRHTFIDGPADVVFEIVAPDSVERDYDDKRREYELGGVSESWIIDPMKQAVTLLVLEASQFVEKTPEQGLLASSVLKGFGIRPDDLWKKPLPDAIDFVLAFER